jgi:hypothetical protein
MDRTENRGLTAIIKWVSHSASILLACVSETLTLFGVANSNENGCQNFLVGIAGKTGGLSKLFLWIGNPKNTSN